MAGSDKPTEKCQPCNNCPSDALAIPRPPTEIADEGSESDKGIKEALDDAERTRHETVYNANDHERENEQRRAVQHNKEQ